MEYIATTFQGLEEILAKELTALGAEVTQIYTRAVGFIADKAMLYKANLHLRTAIRILQPISRFDVNSDQQLYQAAYDINWTDYFDLSQTFAVQSAIHSPYFNHSQYVALKVKDAIVDKFRNKLGSRPNVRLDNPDVRIHIHISGTTGSLLLDSSGESLHKRGYRVATTEAPLNEVLAAGLVLISGWKGETNLIDPMCGSGTIAIEAAMVAANIAPNINRQSFGFQRWKDYDAELWEQTKQAAIAQQRDMENWIYAHDVLPSAIEATKQNIEKAGVDEFVKLGVKDFEHTPAPAGAGLVIVNPPYDLRLPIDDANAFYRMIGDTLKKNYNGYKAWILSGNKDAIKNVGLKAARRHTLYNGPVDCKFYQYELYSGKKKMEEEVPATEK